MREVQLMLVPEPGKAPEFLASVLPVDPAPVALRQWQALPDKRLVLEGYTRDAWAWKPGTPQLQSLVLRSTDGRRKLPGFLGYLKQRQKSAYGRFPPRGLVVVSYVQPSEDADRLEMRLTLDLAAIPNCRLPPLGAVAAGEAPSQPAAKDPGSATTAGGAATARKPGLLGTLVSGAQRTQRTILAAAVPPPPAPPPVDLAALVDGGAAPTEPPPPTAVVPGRTAQQVLNEFRESMQQKMLDFEISSEDVLKVAVSLAAQTAGLPPDDKVRVTMDVLKYMVYEAAEEVDEDWVAHREPSEFLDECTIAVYKAGAAPPEVLEDINRGELPDEVRGQERALALERQRQMERQQQLQQKLTHEQAHRQQLVEEEDELQVLNTEKRDRRTIADYEREKRANGK